MRTKTLLIAAVLGAVGIATASAQVTSVNAVGYVNKSLNAGLSLVANPLSNGGNKVSEVIPSAPIGTAIFLFDANTGFTVTQFVGVWSDDVELPVGTGFYLQLPEAATITFVGEVLQGDDSNKSVPAGLSIQGSTTPRSGTFTELGFPAAVGDTVFLFDGTAFGATTFLGVWAPEEPALAPGDAHFIDKAEAGDWNQDFVIQ